MIMRKDLSIDNAVVGERSVMKREAEKFLKYKDRAVEIQRMWTVKTYVIPVIIEASETVTIQKISEQHTSLPHQGTTKAAIVSAAHPHTHTHTHIREY